ncbi:M28 family peptidase [Dysgonomonas sp. ZJ279]|uniref:M28 family peptidase n=1 Tax=Dysgonomonas sp. ZJ279 TaxID=2709796 RepID=UPI0013EB4BDC|nr:M28 family peptidase [Dysgonomonas sp. ZJ279]
MTLKNISFIALLLSLVACSCSNKTATNTNTVQVYEKISPDFSGDSAYHFVDRQVAFGPRVPNTKEHVACGDYLVGELKRFGADVKEQKMVVTAFDGTKLNARNIIGSYGLDKKTRVLLFAHWDTRPFSDHDENPDNHHKPVLGANDAGSGVGVLLEVARIIQQQAPEIGIDIIFFDAEDYGTPVFAEEKPGDWWCLGSQYWGANPHVPNYKAKYGILLDMVGAKDATFYREAYSMYYARDIVEKVWSTARQLDYGAYFISKDGTGVTDDHVYVNQKRNIPSVDIIHTNADSSFVSHWHTQNDDMSNISKETLKAVGQTILEVIYNEKEK